MHLSPPNLLLPTTYGNILYTAHLYQLDTMDLLGSDLQGSSAQKDNYYCGRFCFCFSVKCK